MRSRTHPEGPAPWNSHPAMASRDLWMGEKEANGLCRSAGQFVVRTFGGRDTAESQGQQLLHVPQSRQD